MAEKKNLSDAFKERKGKVETDAETGTSAVEKLTQSGLPHRDEASVGWNCGCLLMLKNR